jgi:DNA-binding NarL/FixJ family response regulator
MANLLILSNNLTLAEQWKAVLSAEHHVYVLNNQLLIKQLLAQQAISLLVLDGFLLKSVTEMNEIKQHGIKTLVIGNNWSEESQIDSLVSGISGYCEANTISSSLLKAANTILLGDIWVHRDLVPRIIERLIQLNKANSLAIAPTTSTNLQALSQRELAVAKLLRQGKNNKIIASALNISERTVKAHLTSIFTKFNVKNRVHLALLLKEFHL